MEERFVIVKDKNGKLLAKFSNKTPAISNSDKKNLMVSPTIDITSNGDSTLSFQMFVASEKWQAIKNPENLYYCNGRVYTPMNEQSYVYNGPIVNVTLVEIWYLLAYKYVQAHNVDASVEALDDHTVKILPKSDQKFKLTVNGVKYNDSEVKDSRGIVMPRGSAGYALWAILKGSGWTLGVCDVLPDGFNAANDYGTFNVESDMKDILQNIQYIQELYGGILDWDSENKVLNLRDERKEGTDFNTWKGYAIRKGKNLSDYPTITWDNNIITRLYPLGNGNLNIKKVNNNKGYVDNFSYTTDIYESYLQNANIYDTNDEGGQKTLKFWGEQQLIKYCRPRKSISYPIVDVRAVEEQSHENVDINHIVKAYYQDTESGAEIYEFLRVQHMTYNWFFPSSDSTIEVGDKISNEVELFYQVYKQAENSAQTDANGHLSGGDIYLEIPEEYWDKFSGGFGYGSLQEITNLHAEYETQNTQAVADLRVYADDTFATITSLTNFQAWTEDSFYESSTRIDQVSSALSAQIDLEAQHYEEGKEYTQQSIANLKLYVDGDFAQAQLNAAYAYTNDRTNKIENSLASFEAYANRTFATTSQLSVYATYDSVGKLISESEASIKTYATQTFATTSQLSSYATYDDVGRLISQSEANIKTYAGQNYATISQLASYPTYDAVGNLISQSEASIKTYADQNYANVRIEATVSSINSRTSGIENASGFLSVSDGFVILGTSGTGNYLSVTRNAIGINGNVYFMGKQCYWSNGYLRGQ